MLEEIVSFMPDCSVQLRPKATHNKCVSCPCVGRGRDTATAAGMTPPYHTQVKGEGGGLTRDFPSLGAG